MLMEINRKQPTELNHSRQRQKNYMRGALLLSYKGAQFTFRGALYNTEHVRKRPVYCKSRQEVPSSTRTAQILLKVPSLQNKLNNIVRGTLFTTRAANSVKIYQLTTRAAQYCKRYPVYCKSCPIMKVIPAFLKMCPVSFNRCPKYYETQPVTFQEMSSLL